MIVADAGPVIAYARMGRLDLLRRVVGELVIPDAVFQELTGQGHERPGAAEVTNAAWIRRHAVSDQAAVDRLPRVLHRGERQAIVLAREAHLEVPQTLFQLRQHVRTSLHVHGEPPVAAENTISQQILTKQY
jgi:predicted nucleic acid-binding protein